MVGKQQKIVIEITFPIIKQKYSIKINIKTNTSDDINIVRSIQNLLEN